MKLEKKLKQIKLEFELAEAKDKKELKEENKSTKKKVKKLNSK